MAVRNCVGHDLDMVNHGDIIAAIYTDDLCVFLVCISISIIFFF